MRLLIAGGGTGGHIYPALAVARSLREQVDTRIVRDACRDHPYAEAALFLIRRLDILPDLEDIA